MAILQNPCFKDLNSCCPAGPILDLIKLTGLNDEPSLQSNSGNSMLLSLPCPNPQGSLRAMKFFVPSAFCPQIFPKFQLSVVSWETQNIFLPGTLQLFSCFSFLALKNTFQSCFPAPDSAAAPQLLTWTYQADTNFLSRTLQIIFPKVFLGMYMQHVTIPLRKSSPLLKLT